VDNGHKPASDTLPFSNEKQLTLQNMASKPAAGRFLHKDYTFDQFVVGRNNDFAYSASLSIASRRKSEQSCLYLMSKTGLGKSHLAQAIGHHIIAAYPDERVYYVTAEDFSNEMVSSFRNDCFDQFKGKYRSQCDVLLLEDVHYLGGKDRTQQELATTLDSLFEAGKKIIFSSCYRPSEIPRLNDKLRSRFSYGLVSSIEPPDFKTRVRILEKKAKVKGLQIPRDVTHYLAGELTEDIRQLESGIMQVAAKSSLLGMPINSQLAESVIRNIIRTRKTITVDVIKKMVCRHYNVSPQDLVSRSRKQSIVRPRQMAIFLSRRYTDAPLQTIGKAFNRYHATAMHSIAAVEKGCQKSNALRKQVAFFTEKLDQGDF
jgi:chromosomal replication initiator protein